MPTRKKPGRRKNSKNGCLPPRTVTLKAHTGPKLHLIRHLRRWSYAEMVDLWADREIAISQANSHQISTPQEDGASTPTTAVPVRDESNASASTPPLPMPNIEAGG